MAFVAYKESQCHICNATIAIGTHVRPVADMQWACMGCIERNDERTPVCKHWLRRGSCRMGEGCLFRHPEHLQCSQQRVGKVHKKRPKVYNEGRAGCLRRWLIDTFGREYLRKGTGVLDVAGGKGDLAFQLLNLNQVPSTLVEPRPMDLYCTSRMLKYGYYHRNVLYSTYVDRPACICETQRKCYCEDCGVCITAPNHIRGFFECIDAESGLPKMMESEETFLEALQKARDSVWDRKGLHCAHEDDEQPTDANASSEPTHDCASVQQEEEDNEGGDIEEKQCDEAELSERAADEAANAAGDGRVVESYEEAMQIFKNCSLIVGMHPDQAAEPIVDFALANNKPFALVPCCVYSKCFPKRVDETGKPVRSYDEFIQYLLKKDESVRCLQLDFEGKNLLIYSLKGYS